MYTATYDRESLDFLHLSFRQAMHRIYCCSCIVAKRVPMRTAEEDDKSSCDIFLEIVDISVLHL